MGKLAYIKKNSNMKWLNLIVKNVMLLMVNKKMSLLYNNQLWNNDLVDYILKSLFL